VTTGSVLQAGSVVTPAGILSPGWVVIEQGRVVGAGEGVRRGVTSADLGALMLAPGYVDVHVHGGDGAQVNGDTADEVVESVGRIARFHVRHGTTSIVATTVSDSPARLRTTVAGLASVATAGETGGAVVRGIHLEGPYIARAKMGAQDPSALRPADAAELRSLADLAAGTLRLVTVAPELTGSSELIATALDVGCAVAVGHTDAGYDATVAAIEAGATHATHLFNAMPPLHHRMPGAVTALLLDDRVTLEVIADLHHVHPAVLGLVARVAPGRVVAVSDAVTAAGLEPGTYELGRLEVRVEAGRVTLASDPSTLAGSVLTMDVAVRNLVGAAGMSVLAALEAASATPARAARLDSLGVGLIEPGSPADLVVLDTDLGVAATIVGGRVAHDPRELLAGLV
jgi:N-acetylglucosamine-6-phosphate deacetylase